MAKYRVVGPHAVDGVETGGVVEFDFDVSRLIEGGHIKAIAARKTQKNTNSEMSEDG